MSTSRNSHTWDAQKYHENSNSQSDAAKLLIQRIQLKGNERVIDVGCGDGKLTAFIANALPKGSILGTDLSNEMIAFAKESFPTNIYSNLEFKQAPAEKIKDHSKVDIIFSSFALQWVRDLTNFFGSSLEILNNKGKIAATIPLNISTSLEQATKHIISTPKWSAYFTNFEPEWHFKSSKEILKSLTLANYTPSYFKEVSQTSFFASREEFELYITQWFTYLNPLPTDLKNIFLKEVVDKYLYLVSITEGETIPFEFSRVDFIAIRCPHLS